VQAKLQVTARADKIASSAASPNATTGSSSSSGGAGGGSGAGALGNASGGDGGIKKISSIAYQKKETGWKKLKRASSGFLKTATAAVSVVTGKAANEDDEDADDGGVSNYDRIRIMNQVKVQSAHENKLKSEDIAWVVLHHCPLLPPLPPPPFFLFSFSTVAW